MIELRKEFMTKKYNMLHQQLYKDSELVIYGISQPSVDDPSEIVKWYEVFEYRVMPPDQYHNDSYELYPKADEYFGKWAWSCTNDASVMKVLKKHFPNHPMTKGYIDIP